MSSPVQTAKRSAIEDIRGAISEDEAVTHYKEYEAFLRRVASRLAPDQKGYEIRAQNLVETLEEVVDEAARRVSRGGVRAVLANAPREFARSLRIRAPIMTLPMYEEIPRGSRRWKRGESAAIKDYVIKVCKTLNDLRDERVDKWVTVEETRDRIREASFLVEFILRQLEKVGRLEFRHILLQELGQSMKIEIVYLLQPFPDSDRSIRPVLRDFERKGEIPYSVARLLPKNHRYR